ncbi:MAG: hypothetical protein PHV51_04700 [Methanosarcinaceae archaeon]|nr:hypothetical protein [Methanosarcinaceae archaeon]
MLELEAEPGFTSPQQSILPVRNEHISPATADKIPISYQNGGLKECIRFVTPEKPGRRRGLAFQEGCETNAYF